MYIYTYIHTHTNTHDPLGMRRGMSSVRRAEGATGPSPNGTLSLHCTREAESLPCMCYMYYMCIYIYIYTQIDGEREVDG